jgi:hypothetical protein
VTNHVTLYEYNIAANTWATMAPMPVGKNVPGAAAMGGQLWVYGGGNPFSPDDPAAFPAVSNNTERVVPNPFNTMYIYNPATNTWTAGPNLLETVSFVAGIAVGNRAIGVGGYDGATTVQTTEINVTTGGGCPTPPPPTTTRTQTATNTATRTGTSTITRTSTPSPTITPPCGSRAPYAISTAVGTIVPSNTEIDGGRCDDCVLGLIIPFPFSVYDQTFNNVNVSSNGNLQFTTSEGTLAPECNPSLLDFAILAHWDDLNTADAEWCAPNCGMYTLLQGTAPNRTFNIEWRGCLYYGACEGDVHFAVRLYENQSRFDIIYALADNTAFGASIGVRGDIDNEITSFSCYNQRQLSNGLQLTFEQPQCATPVATSTAIATSTITPTSSATSTPPPTSITASPTAQSTHITASPTDTSTNTPTSTAIASPTESVTSTALPTDITASPTATLTITPCAITFTDVPPTHTFYPFIRCLACRGIISGYADGTFRPGNNITRGQLSKIVSNAAGFSDTPPGQTFEDVPTNHTFWLWIERMSSRGIISGYPCGGAGEPCVPPLDRPYFRPGSDATRGQISKIVSNAAGYSDVPPIQLFEDVPPAHTFYLWVQRLAFRSIMGGYACGGAGEPCVPPDNRPYFRPASNATRGQVAKIVANTFYPNCVTPR